MNSSISLCAGPPFIEQQDDQRKGWRDLGIAQQKGVTVQNINMVLRPRRQMDTGENKTKHKRS